MPDTMDNPDSSGDVPIDTEELEGGLDEWEEEEQPIGQVTNQWPRCSMRPARTGRG